MANSSNASSGSSPESKHPLRKAIVICCDGTACTAFKGDDKIPQTNVARIARCIKPVSDTGIPQVVHYMPGIGTGDENELNPLNSYNLGTGRGVEEKIIEGYSFICHNYYTPDDMIILIGFSRGAFIARCIADLVCKIGVLTKFSVYYVRDIYDMWRDAGETGEDPFNSDVLELDEANLENQAAPAARTNLAFQDNGEQRVQGRMNRTGLLESIQAADETIIHRGVRIEVCAVWDTVAALGPIVSKLGFLRPRQSRKLGFIRSDFSQGINNGFQALSLHDRRRAFLPIVWKQPQNGGNTTGNDHAQRLEQCWFMGYHGDVGGGIHGEGLAHFPLVWMLTKLWEFLDIDAYNFWNPHLGVSNWHISNREVRLQIKSKDTLSLLYRFGGIGYRKPRRQFWAEKGFQELSNIGANDSSEYMHFTVRCLTEAEVVKPCKALRNAGFWNQETENGRETTWNIPMVSHSTWRRPIDQINTRFNLKINSKTVYEVPEPPKDGGGYLELARELALLKMWTDTELLAIQSSSDEGNADVGNLVARLKVFMEDMVYDMKQEMIQKMIEGVKRGMPDTEAQMLPEAILTSIFEEYLSEPFRRINRHAQETR
ncbi:hypothetical protein GQX73_g4900 [Xylaria multiplex]|uniref:T6SS Phospholipase effector Tle1-like catalytic domain-containing protein n=1 Tax=Xylaria multiplex TaxID=323545 RepID=A0A7C8MMD3_9PEZI|nr:hypothetical protein GQX73_g4900 [Xylaria multiplex]